MGFLSSIFGGGSSSGGTVDTTSVPGIFDDNANETGKEIAQFLKTKGEERFGTNLAQTQIQPFNIPASTPGFDFSSAMGQSPITQEYQRNLLNPSWNTQNPVEQAILNDLRQQVGGQSATRGLELTDQAILQTIAPTLRQFQQDRSTQLQNAFTPTIQSMLEGRRQDMSERGADIEALTQGRYQDIIGSQADKDAATNTLLALADLSRPTPVVKGGSSSQQGGILGGLGDLGTAVMAGMKLFG